MSFSTQDDDFTIKEVKENGSEEPAGKIDDLDKISINNEWTVKLELSRKTARDISINPAIVRIVAILIVGFFIGKYYLT